MITTELNVSMNFFLTVIYDAETVSNPEGVVAQQEAGQIGPCKVKRRRQHSPLAAVHRTGPPHSVMDMTVIPAAPAAPTSPSPPRTGARPARPRPGAREEVTAAPAVKRRAAPPDTTGKLTEIEIL